MTTQLKPPIVLSDWGVPLKTSDLLRPWKPQFGPPVPSALPPWPWAKDARALRAFGLGTATPTFVKGTAHHPVVTIYNPNPAPLTVGLTVNIGNPINMAFTPVAQVIPALGTVTFTPSDQTFSTTGTGGVSCVLTYAGLSSTVTIGQVTVIPVGSLTIANLKITFGGSIVQPGDYIPVNAPNTEIKIVGDMTNPNPVDVKWYVMSALRVPSGGAFSYGTGPSFTNLAQGATATAVTLAVFGQVAQVDPLSGPPITLTYSVVLQMRVGIDDYTQEVATGTLIAYHAVAPTVTPTW